MPCFFCRATFGQPFFAKGALNNFYERLWSHIQKGVRILKKLPKSQKTQNGWPLRESPKSFYPLRKNIPADATDDDFRLSILTVEYLSVSTFNEFKMEPTRSLQIVVWVSS